MPEFRWHDQSEFREIILFLCFDHILLLLFFDSYYSKTAGTSMTGDHSSGSDPDNLFKAASTGLPVRRIFCFSRQPRRT